MASFLSKSMAALGLILLAHAYVTSDALRSSLKAMSLISPVLTHSCYSAYEFSSLHANGPQASTVGGSSGSSQSSTSASLPLDISLETIVSVVFICLGLVVGAEDLKPINWRVWAEKVEKESGGGGPFQGLEDRLGFVDIRVCRFHLLCAETWGIEVEHTLRL